MLRDVRRRIGWGATVCGSIVVLWTVYCLYGFGVLAVEHDRGIGFAGLALVWFLISALLGVGAGVAYGIHRTIARGWERAAKASR